MSFKKVCAVLALSALSFNASAAVLNVNSSGILMGATGVDVGGTLYDVAIADGIVGNSTFLFTDFDSAKLASQALLDQVFIDGALGQFDSNPTLTNGCSVTTLTLCSVRTGYAVSGASALFASANNALLNWNDFPLTSPSFMPSVINTANLPLLTIATWSVTATAPTTSVPEPETYAMFMAGLGLMGFASRRKKA